MFVALASASEKPMRAATLVVVFAVSSWNCNLPGQTRQFEPDQTRYPATLWSGDAQTFAAGDVDGDGDLDLLVALQDPWQYRVSAVLLLRQGAAWAATTLGTAQGINVLPKVDPALLDVDGDGDLDAVATVSGEFAGSGARLVMWRNAGVGMFAGAAVLALPGSAGGTAQIAAADVDLDGDRDLVVATRAASPQPLALYVHDGAFGFTLAPGALPPTSAMSPDLVDLDGDGDVDIVAANAAGEVVVLTNQTGTFTAGAVVPAAALHVAAADVDGDLDGDVFVQRADGAVALLRNTPGGWQTQALAAGRANAGRRPLVLDLDGDQDRDLVVHADEQVSVLRNDGSGTFAAEFVAASAAFAAADANQDGAVDLLLRAGAIGIVAACGVPGRVAVEPTMLRGPLAAFANTGYAEDTDDLDGDGRVDIVQENSWLVYVRRNLGFQKWATVVLPVPFQRPRVRSADVDGDGDRDLAIVDNNQAGGGLMVWRNDGSFAFTALPVQPLANAYIVGKGDFDGDQRTDLLVAMAGDTLHLLRSTGGGVFAAPTQLPVAMDDPPGIWDLDGDQDLDLVVPFAGSCTALLTNDGSGAFAVTNPCAFSSLVRTTLVDIDGDTDADAFTWSYGSGQLWWNNAGTFVLAGTIQGVQSSSLLQPHFADWDDDGDVDLLQLGGPPQLWLNPGNGALVDTGNARVGWTSFTASGAADLDGDGDPDVVPVVGMNNQQRVNHMRSATSLTLPTPGGQMSVRFASEPGYATAAALCIPIVSLQPRFAPLAVPGIRGTLQIDLAVSALLPALTLQGPATSTFAIPLQPGLLGFDLYMQGLLFTTTTIAFTPAVHERVL
jgi:hypothetical protein